MLKDNPDICNVLSLHALKIILSVHYNIYHSVPGSETVFAKAFFMVKILKATAQTHSPIVPCGCLVPVGSKQQTHFECETGD